MQPLSELPATSELLNLPPPAVVPPSSPSIDPLDMHTSQLSTMSLNNSNNSHVNNNVNIAANNNNYPSFLESPGGGNSLGGVPRLAPSPMASQPQLQVNGNGNGAGMNGMGVGLPMNAGQQMDVNMLYQKVIELSEVLKENREKTQGIVAGAEELAARAAASGATTSLQEANTEITTARIVDLERQLAQERNKVHVLIREQKENTKLIGEYETAVGSIVEMVRNYSFNNKTEYNSLALHYNKLLQEEKDAHLEARKEKDHWHARFMESIGMLREAFRLRCEEEDIPIRVVAGLQNEVRAYRNALGMEPEKWEEEYGWEILKDVRGGSGDS